MKRTYVSFLLIFTTLQFYAQVSFENGYFINNQNEKVECLIKNIDWEDNPKAFTYKFSEDEEAQTKVIKNVMEFGIYNFSKYVRADVGIDRSKKDINNMSLSKSPEFQKEQVFLKVLINGKASLYFYKQSNLKRFFFSIDSKPISQLIYKNYKTINNQIAENNEFRAQLWKNLKCGTLKKYHFENLSYFKSSLLKIFTKYNNCINAEYESFEPKNTKGLLNIVLTANFANNSLKSKNTATKFQKVADFGNKTNLGLGFEIESIFKFNKNKWAVVANFNYQSFEGEAVTKPSNFSNTINHTLDYKSIELAFGGRHYLYLNKKSKLFVNAFYMLDFPINSSLVETSEQTSRRNEIEVVKSSNYSIGIGYRYNNKYSLEIRHDAKRAIFDFPRTSEYNGISLIFGFNIF